MESQRATLSLVDEAGRPIEAIFVADGEPIGFDRVRSTSGAKVLFREPGASSLLAVNSARVLLQVSGRAPLRVAAGCVIPKASIPALLSWVSASIEEDQNGQASTMPFRMRG